MRPTLPNTKRKNLMVSAFFREKSKSFATLNRASLWSARDLPGESKPRKGWQALFHGASHRFLFPTSKQTSLSW